MERRSTKTHTVYNAALQPVVRYPRRVLLQARGAEGDARCVTCVHVERNHTRDSQSEVCDSRADLRSRKHSVIIVRNYENSRPQMRADTRLLSLCSTLFFALHTAERSTVTVIYIYTYVYSVSYLCKSHHMHIWLSSCLSVTQRYVVSFFRRKVIPFNDCATSEFDQAISLMALMAS